MTQIEPPERVVSLSLLGMMLAAVIVPLNSTMIAIALPDISDDLSVGKGTAGTLVIVYLIVMLVGQPLGGRIGDQIGSRAAVILGLTGVALTSVIAVAVDVFVALVIVRGIQAIFAALLVPNAQAMIRATTPPEQAGRVFGMFGSVIGAGAALGPLIGGGLVALAGWQALFIVNVPIVVAAAAMIRTGDMTRRAPDKQAEGPAERGGTIWNRAFTGAFSTQALTVFGQYTLILVVPVMLDERGWSPGATGMILTALTIGMVVMGPPGGSFGDRHGRRRPAVIGIAIAFAMITIGATLGSSIAVWVLVVVLTGFGFGFGFAAPNLMTTAITWAPADRAATASGLYSMSRYSGSIPASSLFAAMVGTGTEGIDELLVIAAACAAAALAASSLLPDQAQPSPQPVRGVRN